MARLILPTRNRSTSLDGVLTFLARFHPDTELIIADGSSDRFKSENAENIKKIGRDLAIDYRQYPEELPFFERLLEVIKGESDEFLIMASDDDFPMMDALKSGETHLRGHPECSTAIGALVSLYLKSDSRIEARLNPARPVLGDNAEQRVKAYSAWPFSTTYAVSRREFLIERYERAQSLFLAGFFDYMIGVHDATLGTVHAIPEIGFFSTRNYNHSYLRPEDPLAFLRHSHTTLAIKDVFKADLIKHAGLGETEAENLSVLLIKRRISENVGNVIHKKPGFSESHLFLNKMVQRQWQLFHDVFEADSPARQRYSAELDYIAGVLKTNAKSNDNAGEAGQYETLADQLADKRTAAGAGQPRVPPVKSNAGAPKNQTPVVPSRLHKPKGNADTLELTFDVDPATMLRM